MCLHFVFVFLRMDWVEKITEGNELTLGPFPGNLAGTLALPGVIEQSCVTDDITE